MAFREYQANNAFPLLPLLIHHGAAQNVILARLSKHKVLESFNNSDNMHLQNVHQ